MFNLEHTLKLEIRNRALDGHVKAGAIAEYRQSKGSNVEYCGWEDLRIKTCGSMGEED